VVPFSQWSVGCGESVIGLLALEMVHSGAVFVLFKLSFHAEGLKLGAAEPFRTPTLITEFSQLTTTACERTRNAASLKQHLKTCAVI